MAGLEVIWLAVICTTGGAAGLGGFALGRCVGWWAAADACADEIAELRETVDALTRPHVGIIE